MRILPAAIFSLLASAALADPPRVSADIAPVHSLVVQVMEGVATPDLLIDPGASPHGYALRPSQARALQQSDIVFWVGADLTPWLQGVIEDIAPNAETVALLDDPSTILLEPRDVAVFEHHDHEEERQDEHDHDDHGPDDHDGHDEHRGVDPHAFLDPVNGKLWLQAIAGHLAEADPENAVTYQANATRAIQALDAQIKAINTGLAAHRGKNFIVFHDAFQYFEARFGLTASGAIRLGDATTPSAARLAKLQAEIKKEGVVCAFSEPQFDDSLLTTIAGEDVKTGILDPQGAKIAPGPAFYGQWMGDLAKSFADCLR